MLLDPIDEESGKEDDPLTAWEKREEFKAVQWQWFLIAIYVVGLVMFVTWILTGL